MDAANTFETPGTYRALRAEYLTLAVGAGYLLWRQRKDVRWPVAAGLFLAGDLVGYLPGAFAFRRSRDGRVPRRYYAAYNVAHSVLTATAVAAAWSKRRGPEWALLVIPLHIGIDRGLFGNFMKQYSVSFEPHAHPVWEHVREQLTTPWEGEGAHVSSSNGSAATMPAAPGGSRR
ncbi:MAG TPA: hypothetical protein VKB25_10465 [Conexibacter sp.]|nr:hypothetical protein [Conexibacter sp.]